METTNEQQIKVLTQENEDLRELLEIQEGKLERAVFAIYHLHGGLYNQISQRYILAKKNALLSGQPLLAEEETTEDQEFTTRQGDRNELRIQQMEQTINMLEKKIEYFETKTNKY
jgi:predicted secreted protein